MQALPPHLQGEPVIIQKPHPPLGGCRRIGDLQLCLGEIVEIIFVIARHQHHRHAEAFRQPIRIGHAEQAVMNIPRQHNEIGCWHVLQRGPRVSPGAAA